MEQPVHRAGSSSPWLAATLVALLVGGATAQDREGTPDVAGRAWLGISIRDLDREDARRLDLRPGTDGVLISEVDDGSPADEAGLRAGDVVTEIDGRTVRDRQRFVSTIQAHEPGDRLRLTVWRDGRTQSYTVRLGSRPEADDTPPTAGLDRDDPEATQPGELPRLRAVGPRLGVEVLELDADLAPYFDSQPGEGVLVTSVMANSGAARAGLRAGDVLLRLDGEPVRHVEELQAALGRHRAGDEVEITLRRRGREERLKVEVSDLAPARLGLGRWFERPAAPFAGDSAELERQMRQMERRIQELEREVRALRRQ
jgi:S1-C subfamily serine protease